MRHGISLEAVVTPENFEEGAYLRANPDVQKAIKDGFFECGRQHFECFGQKERRTFRDPKIIAAYRKKKLEQIEPFLRNDMERNDRLGIPSFLTPELESLARIAETDSVSEHQYDEHGLSVIDKYKDGIVLDCGAGQRPTYYENVINYEIVAYDTTDVLGVGEELPFQNNTFDAVISVAVLEHVQNPFVCAKEISRVLKPGGELYCAVPFLQPYHGYPHHYFNATWQGIRRLFEDELEIEEVFVPPALHPAVALGWIVQSWASGLPPAVQEEFLAMRLGDMIGEIGKLMDMEFCRRLTDEKVSELACGNSLRARKPS
jgi:SAM-dependent methyltransferase